VRTFGHSCGEVLSSASDPEFLDVVEKFGRVGYWRIDLRTETILFSAEVCRTHGLPPGYRPESLKECTEWYHPEDRGFVAETVNAATQDGEPFSFEARLQTVANGIRWVAVNGEVRKDDTGTPETIIGTLTDISAERELNIRLGEALRAAQSARRLKDMFLSNMNHELRTPLNAIIGFSQLIKMMEQQQEGVCETVGEYAADIETAGAQLLSLIEDIFCLAKMEAESEVIELEPVDIGTLLEDVRSLTGVSAREKNQTVQFDDCQLASVHVVADRGKLSQILVYLVSNALKVSPEDETIQVTTRLNHCGRVFVNVIDKGPGISPDQHERIFDRFERMDPSERSVEGISVGLTISRDMVASMGGEIGVESVEGEGATFWLSFPVIDVAEYAEAV